MSFARVAAAAAVVMLACGTARAQFGIFTLPRNDFTWTWGRDSLESARPKNPDFTVRGHDAEFACLLTGELKVSSNLTVQEIRELEMSLQTALSFVENAYYTMNALESSLDLDWARLECTIPEGGEVDPEKSAERVEKARQKAIEDMLRRRERRESQQ